MAIFNASNEATDSTEFKNDVEHVDSGSSRSVLNEEPAPFDQGATKRLLRKMDYRLVPFLSLLYLLSFLDRTNIGNARLFDLEEDLGMTGLDYNVALSVFFPFYVIAEVPSNMMMKKFRPSVWLTFIMVIWSVVVIGMAFVTSFAGLVIARAFLGFAEAGLFPGVTYYITMWYRKNEITFRIALFFSAATAAGAFGGLLAFAIGKMSGLAGRSGWSWIFLIEGLLTLAVACVAYWAINDYPSTAKFLTPDERVEVERRLKEDRGSLADEFNMKFFWDALKDWKIYVHMFITIGIYTPVYSFSLFLPTILKNMGYTKETSQLMSIPPYALACAVTIIAGYVADKRKQRGIFMLFFLIVSIVGFVMLVSTNITAVQYVGTFCAAAGIFPLVPIGVSWNGNNIGGSLKRGVGIAMHVGMGNLGGTMASYIYLPHNAPRFISGHAALIGMLAMSFVLTVFMMVYCKRENARRDREYATRPEDYTQEMMEAEREMGDNATFFRYTI